MATSFLDDPRRRAMLQLGLGMLGTSGSGQGIGTGLMQAGTAALNTYDQMISAKKEEERAARRERMERAEFRQMSKVRSKQLKAMEQEIKDMEETQAGKQKIADIAQRLPALEDPKHQERVARNLMGLGSMYGVDVGDIVRPYTKEGKLDYATAEAGLGQAQSAIRANESRIRSDEALLPLQIQGAQADIAQSRAATSASQEQTRGAAAERKQKEMALASAQAPITVRPIDLPGGQQIYETEQGGVRSLLDQGAKGGLTPPTEPMAMVEAPPPQALSREQVEQAGVARERQQAQQAASQTLRGIASTVNSPLYGAPMVGGNAQRDLATIKRIYGDLTDDDKRLALDIIGKLQAQIRRQ